MKPSHTWAVHFVVPLGHTVRMGYCLHTLCVWRPQSIWFPASSCWTRWICCLIQQGCFLSLLLLFCYLLSPPPQLGDKHRCADIQYWPPCLELLLVPWWHQLRLCRISQWLRLGVWPEGHERSCPGVSTTEIQVSVQSPKIRFFWKLRLENANGACWGFWASPKQDVLTYLPCF